MANDESDEPGSLREDLMIPPAVEVPSRRVVGPGVWAFTVLLALVGAGAVLLALGVALLFGVLKAGDPGLNQAVDRLTTAAHALPGVQSANVKPGLGDLGTTPRDIYGDIQLTDACTSTSLAVTTQRLRAIMAREKAFRWHPTVWCHGRGLTVSPDAAITAQRLAVVGQLAADKALNAAAVIVTQRGDDPSPDLDNASVQVDLYVRPRTTATVARAWLDRLRSTFPSSTVFATTGRPGEYRDELALQNGQWTVVVEAQDPQSAALLRTAARMEQSSVVLGAYIEGPARQAAVIASSWSVLQDLQHALPASRTDEEPLHLAITLSRKPAN